MIIACDIDGVLADFNKGFAKLFPNLRVPLESKTFPQVWDWPQALGASPDETLAAWEHIQKSHSFWEDLDPMDGALEAIALLAEASLEAKHEIYFVTNRFGMTCQQQTVDWLSLHGMPDTPPERRRRKRRQRPSANELSTPIDHTISQSFSSWEVIVPLEETKAEVLAKIGANVFIDDRPDNLKGVAATTRCYLFNMPYNTTGRMKAEGTEIGRFFSRTSSVAEVLRRELEGRPSYACHLNHDDSQGLTAPQKKQSNPKDAVGTTKIPMHLWPETATATGALALMDGALKNERNNWRDAGVRASIYVDALRRHLARWWEGEDDDPDSGLPHEAHMLACLSILVDAKALHMLTDDRNHKGEGLIHTLETLTPHVARLQNQRGYVGHKRCQDGQVTDVVLCEACTKFFAQWRCNKEDECSCPRCQGLCECSQLKETTDET